MMRIDRLEAAFCPLPLDRPIRLGSMEYRTRDYVALRLFTTDGIEGHALGFARGVPVGEGVVGLAPFVVGVDIHDPAEVIRAIRRAFIPGWPGLIRSASLIDIALWDVLAKSRGVSLARLLQAERASVPVVAVAGYFADIRSIESVAEEVAQRAGEGYATVKIVLAAHSAGRDERLLTALRSTSARAIGLAADAHAAWASVDEALVACRPLEEFGLEFIEDPFVPQAWRSTLALAARLATPLAAGEDVVGIEGLEDALEAAAVLRVDATSSGGITFMLEAIALAAEAGRRVLPVVWPGLHGQLAAARRAVASIEVIPEDTRAELSGRLLATPVPIAGGEFVVGSAPGAGMDLDWRAVRASAAISWSA